MTSETLAVLKADPTVKQGGEKRNRVRASFGWLR